MAQSGDPFSSLSGIKSVSAEQYAGAPPQQPSGGMDGTPPGSGYGAPMMRPGGPGADEEARRGVMSLQASLVRHAGLCATPRAAPRAAAVLESRRPLLRRRALCRSARLGATTSVEP